MCEARLLKENVRPAILKATLALYDRKCLLAPL
jgi:hypothetical protein